jgi:TRAP-type mannitol/chloroaromatic compound transport system substrate-binding protein
MRRAILIASANFDADSGIEPLRFPENDVTALESILRTEEFGFEHFSKVVDQPNNQVFERLDHVISESEFDDFVLIYFSGHGKINSTGELFLSCRNTKENRLNSTALKYRHIMELLETHARDRVAIILDCCYAGRAVSGLKGSIQEQVKSELDTGRGIFVLGASGATQTAEERELEGQGIFTKQIIEGLTTGSADADNDGYISLNDLAKYVRDEFRKRRIGQDPIAVGVIRSGDLILGSNRKTIHSKTVASIKLKIDSAKPQLTKGTYRAIEDYLDSISTRSDFTNIDKEHEFQCLRTFAVGGSIEEVIVAFRQYGAKDEKELRQIRELLIAAKDFAELNRLSKRIGIYLQRYPNDVEGVDLKDRILEALKYEQGRERALKNAQDREKARDQLCPTETSEKRQWFGWIKAKWAAAALGAAAVATIAILLVTEPTVPPFETQRPPPELPQTAAKEPTAPLPGASSQANLRLASAFPKSVPELFEPAEQFAKSVKADSLGNVEVQLFAAGEIVPSGSVLEAVANGTIESGWIEAGSYMYKDPAFGLVAGGSPLGINATALAGWVYGNGKIARGEVFAQHDVVALPCSILGPKGLWVRKRLQGLGDLNGMKLRVTGAGGAAFAGLRAVPQVLPAGDIYTALEKGVIEGAQWGTPTMDERMGFAKVAQYYYYPVSDSSVLDMIINKQVWDKLGASTREIIEGGCRGQFKKGLAVLTQDVTAALQRIQKVGPVAMQLPAPIAAGLRQTTSEIFDQRITSGPGVAAWRSLKDVR